MPVVNMTDSFVRKLRPEANPRYVVDRTGLALRVGAAATGGTKTWSFRYRINRSMRRLTLGKLADVPLAEARKRVRDAKKQIAAGIDPADEKHQRRTAATVSEFAETFIEQQKKKLRQWRGVKSRLDNDVLPLWKHKLMRDITRRDVRELVDDIAARPAPISANRVRALLSKFFNVAIQMDIVQSNPVTGTPRPGVERRRDRVLTSDEIRRFWAATEALPLEMRAFWQLRLLTAQRGGEVDGMRWAEVDLASGWWTIPPERSKNKLAHRVPLSDTALQLLKDIAAETEARVAKQRKPRRWPYVLRNARRKKAQAAAAVTFGIPDFRGHDLRRTAASLMTGSGTSRLVVSKILNHAEPGVTAVYDRHGYDAEKRAALDSWARTLNGILNEKDGATVLPFARG